MAWGGGEGLLDESDGLYQLVMTAITLPVRFSFLPRLSQQRLAGNGASSFCFFVSLPSFKKAPIWAWSS